MVSFRLSYYIFLGTPIIWIKCNMHSIHSPNFWSMDNLCAVWLILIFLFHCFDLFSSVSTQNGNDRRFQWNPSKRKTFWMEKNKVKSLFIIHCQSFLYLFSIPKSFIAKIKIQDLYFVHRYYFSHQTLNILPRHIVGRMPVKSKHRTKSFFDFKRGGFRHFDISIRSKMPKNNQNKWTNKKITIYLIQSLNNFKSISIEWNGERNMYETKLEKGENGKNTINFNITSFSR